MPLETTRTVQDSTCNTLNHRPRPGIPTCSPPLPSLGLSLASAQVILTPSGAALRALGVGQPTPPPCNRLAGCPARSWLSPTASAASPRLTPEGGLGAERMRGLELWKAQRCWWFPGLGSWGRCPPSRWVRPSWPVGLYPGECAQVWKTVHIGVLWPGASSPEPGIGWRVHSRHPPAPLPTRGPAMEFS